MVMNYTEAENLVYEATNEDPWGPTGPQMKEIANYTFQVLEHYKYVDDRGRDQGLNVRHRVKLILELLGDDDKLRAQRKKVKSDNKDRYQGYTSEDIRMGRGGSYNSELPISDDDFGDFATARSNPQPVPTARTAGF
ncbi:ENTH domain protein [Ancylostoma duodenale]|uniref:ENTH domain protein n=1 Tax=Ancylostoma duodenale TaxID=51022 RepID=A0A0C2HIL4_9BILA|nr:ENTH domain protein [Ancylostoma duodenale]